MQYFEGLKEEQDLKNRYKELVKKYHPDLGGNVETMKQVNAQYDEVLMGKYQASGLSEKEIEKAIKDNHALRNSLNAIIGFPGLLVELCGSWIWVTGETKAVKEELKLAGFKWASKKLAWYWHGKEYQAGWNKSRREMCLDEIRYKHGSVKVDQRFKTYAIA